MPLSFGQSTGSVGAKSVPKKRSAGAAQKKPRKAKPAAGASSTNEETSTTTSSAASADQQSDRDSTILSGADYRLELVDFESRFLLTVYGQMAQFSYVGEQLLGSAIEVNAIYALGESAAAGISIAQALDPSAGLAILYTGIRASGSYAIFGSFIRKESVLSVDGKTNFISTFGKGSMLATDFGLEQLIFNGTSRIIPATGFSAGLRYDFVLFGANVSLAGRYGQLVISEKLASMMTVGGGILMRF